VAESWVFTGFWANIPLLDAGLSTEEIRSDVTLVQFDVVI